MEEFLNHTMQNLTEDPSAQNSTVSQTGKNAVTASALTADEMESCLIHEIRSLRRKKRITQKELAERVGISQQALSRIEHNSHSPSLNLFLSILDALGYEISLVKKA